MTAKINTYNYSLYSLLLRLWGHITPRRRFQFVLLLIVMILASFAEIISIGAVLPFLGILTAPDQIFEYTSIKPIIDLLNITEPKQLLLPLTILFSIAAISSGVMRLIQLILITRLSHAVGADLSVNIYKRTLYQPYIVHLGRNSSEVIAGISAKANATVYVIILPFLNILSSVMMLSFVLVTLILIDPIVAISTFLGFGTIYGLVVFSTKSMLLKNSQRVNQKLNQMFKALQEGLGGIREVLIDRTQVIYCKIYRNADLPLRRAQANIAIISNSPKFGIEALGMVLIAIIAYFLSNNSKSFTESIPLLGALALGAQRSLPMAQLFFASFSGLRGGTASLYDTLELLNQPLPAYINQELPAPIPFKKNITLKNLTFRYSTETPLVLKNSLNLNISKGSHVGFIGATGSGKSTLLDIIMGLLQPTSGILQVDGVSIVENNHQSWLSRIAHVPQTIFLADTSIAENIAFGVPIEEIDHNRIKKVAQQAQISKTIESLSQKYKTIVGERGIRLSGGQRQRIAIARALYKKADVIIFDEATSALDNDTEHTVMESIKNLDANLTVIIVAHRLSTLRHCSQIVELNEGQIERIGSFKNIVKQKKLEKL